MIFHESRDNGWVALRRNLVPHVEDGRMTGPEWMVLTMLITLADSDSGEVVTCSEALRKLFHFGKELDDRAMRRILDRLDEKGYIYRDITPGKRGIYLIRINKYAITTGINAGKQAQTPPKIRRESGSEMPLTTPCDAPENAVITPCGSSTESTGSSNQKSVLCRENVVRTPCDAPENGSELPTIQQQDLRQKQEKEKDTHVLVVVPPTEEGESDGLPSLSILESDLSRGTDICGSPLKLGEGQIAPVDMSSRHHQHGQDNPDHVNGDHKILNGEYLCPVQSAVAGDPAAPTTPAPAPTDQPNLDAPFPFKPAPVGPPSIHAPELAKFYFELIGSPAEIKGKVEQWEKIASAMLVNDSLADLKGMAEYAVNHKAFWQAKMLVLSRDPFRYFQQRINSTDPYSLRAQYGGIKNARAFNQQHNQKSEANHGQKTTAGKSAAPTRADKARAAAEQAKRDILGR